MALAKSLFLLFLIYNLLLLKVGSKCPKSFHCAYLGSLEFPFSHDPRCGLFVVEGCHSGSPKIQLGSEGSLYLVRNISTNTLVLFDLTLHSILKHRSCLSFRNWSTHQSPFISFTFSPNLTFFTCSNHTYYKDIQHYFQNYRRVDCQIRPPTVYYRNPTSTHVPAANGSSIPTTCSVIQLPVMSNQGPGGPGHKWAHLSSVEFILEWNVSEACYECHRRGGQCLSDDMNKFYCKKEGKSRWKLILSISASGTGVLLLVAITYIIWKRKKKIGGGGHISRNISSNPSSKPDIGGGSFYFGIPIFSYTELEEATNNFDPSKELGDGGFGTVYYGKLQDGREVAIKRLYQRNCKRVEQFLNEIKILTGLRHPNLVSLYGCTSRRSRELLLVYEYIPNGTVADHLYGERAVEALLSWPVRMNIAIETATALAYLHKSDIIHRDVKTNNILIDNNFCVKVVDFGLSRLFPSDVTHISTTPQGTPGYVDPEYYQCYELTDRSDVYSFGVVLIELISSMPAVDTSRHRHEINLANLAVNRIQQRAFDELIDPSLGYKSDPEVTRMTTSMAELAFQCLQLEKDMRPSMDEVLAFLKDIKGGMGCNFEQIKEANGNYSVPGKIPPSPETDDVVMLKKNNFQSSPTAVTERWASSGSTRANSIG